MSARKRSGRGGASRQMVLAAVAHVHGAGAPALPEREDGLAVGQREVHLGGGEGDQPRGVLPLQLRRQVVGKDARRRSLSAAQIADRRGGALAPVLLAVERRIKTAVLWIPGLYSEPIQPEVDVINFLPRMTIPTLVLSGRYDYNFPDETSSTPFFEKLGTPPDRKRRVVYDTGHNLPQNQAVKETLDWLDKELGPVQAPGG